MKHINTENRNRYALITGASSGFGYEFAKLFAADGYNLIIVGRNEKQLQKITDDLKVLYDVEVTPVLKDLFDKNAADAIYNHTKTMGINVDVLVNDAGQGQWGKFADTTLERDLDIVQLNIVTLLSLTKLFLRDMLVRGEGKILQLASEAGKTPMPLMAVYAATKAFVISFTEALINETENTGVSITMLLPGASDTDFFHKAQAEKTVVYKEDDLADPVEVAKAGYEGLMKGERRVTVGAGAKSHVAQSALVPDNVAAENMRKKMELSDKPDKENRREAMHDPSFEERLKIVRETGELSGDYKSN